MGIIGEAPIGVQSQDELPGFSLLKLCSANRMRRNSAKPGLSNSWQPFGSPAGRPWLAPRLRPLPLCTPVPLLSATAMATTKLRNSSAATTYICARNLPLLLATSASGPIKRKCRLVGLCQYCSPRTDIITARRHACSEAALIQFR